MGFNGYLPFGNLLLWQDPPFSMEIPEGRPLEMSGIQVWIKTLWEFNIVIEHSHL